MTLRHIELAEEAQAAFESGDALKAAQMFAAALEIAPGDPILATNLGHASFMTGDFASAHDAYARATELAPTLAAAWTGLGNARRRLDDARGAIDAYRNAIERGAEDAATLNGLGIALKDDGQLEDAERAYRRALEIAPSAPIYVNLGNALGDQGKRNEAVAAYEAALLCNGASAEAHFNLFAAVYDDDTTRGEECLRAALHARPDYMPARFHLGALEALRGRDSEAEALLDGAAEHLLSSLAFVRERYRASTAGPVPQIFTDGFRLLESALEQCRVEGTVLELGVRRGTSIRFIAEKVGGRIVHGFDSFEGLPTDWGGLAAGAYSTSGELPRVPSNVVLHAGWFADTLGPFARATPDPIRFMNVDCDLYASTREAFEALGKRLVDGSVVVFDEYLANPGWENEEHRALVEAAAAHGFGFDYIALSLFSRQAAVVIRKKP